MTNQECYEYLKSILKESVKRDMEYYSFLKAKRSLNQTSMEVVERNIKESEANEISCERFLDEALILLEHSSN